MVVLQILWLRVSMTGSMTIEGSLQSSCFYLELGKMFKTGVLLKFSAAVEM